MASSFDRGSNMFSFLANLPLADFGYYGYGGGGPGLILIIVLIVVLMRR